MDRMAYNNQRPAANPEAPVGANSKSGLFSQPSLASKILVGLSIVAALLVVVAMALSLLPKASSSNLVKTDQYQAVFLSNGQVYFGKLSNVNSGYVKLSDIYYLQVEQQVQPDQNQDNDEQPQVSLAKLGNELHGPEDQMYIANDQVVFWENLKNDGSRVVDAIREYQRTGGQSQVQEQGNGNQNTDQ